MTYLLEGIKFSCAHPGLANVVAHNAERAKRRDRGDR